MSHMLEYSIVTTLQKHKTTSGFWNKKKLKTRLIQWLGDDTYSLKARQEMSLPLPEEGLVALVDFYKNKGQVVPFSSDRSLISIPEREQQQRPRNNKRRHEWQRISLRAYAQEIENAEATYKEHISSYKYGSTIKDNIREVLPKEGLPQGDFPTCVPKQMSSSNELGFGLMALEPIPKESQIGEYLGKICKSVPHNKSYVMDYYGENKLYIDAREYGNFMRFMNHSCNPNAKVTVETDRDRFERPIVSALKDIQANEFITIRYSDDKAPAIGL